MDFSSHASLLNQQRSNHSEESSLHSANQNAVLNSGSSGMVGPSSVNVFPYRDPEFVFNQRGGARVAPANSEGTQTDFVVRILMKSEKKTKKFKIYGFSIF